MPFHPLKRVLHTIFGVNCCLFLFVNFYPSPDNEVIAGIFSRFVVIWLQGPRNVGKANWPTAPARPTF
jgi:hypothetical protein